ncbi:MAG: TrbG/VirB9 family P-type conjugative transfer protein [Alphaproteobacteria bacterium]|nr:TrbG/VirB9 family P-type conjugative transfer protein [Alphaproteobacteria bacterium]
MMLRTATLRFIALAGGVLAAALVHAAQPITTDSRIKTLVFNPNEVFTVTTHYGYQSNIEFGPKEIIDTISVGDRIAWQITPAGRRLFIRAQEENAHTNMTVVTNLRAYQFDLRSSAADAVFGSEELTYVVRFFYPEDAAAGLLPPPARVTLQAPPPPSATPAPVAAVAPSAPIFNYRYTYSGAAAAAPVKIFDDGKSTFFKFSGAASPRISVITANGETLDVATRRTSDGLIAVNVIAPRFKVQQAGQNVLVYNEAGGVL